MDDQMGFDIEFDAKTEAFLDWVAPERMESEVHAFLAKVAPDLADDSQWWKPPLSTQIMEAAAARFRNWADFIAPGNRELADGFIRFLGECYVRRGGMTWTNRPEWTQPLYADFTPSVQGFDTRSMVAIAEHLTDNDGPNGIEYSIREAARWTRDPRSVR